MVLPTMPESASAYVRASQDTFLLRSARQYMYSVRIRIQVHQPVWAKTVLLSDNPTACMLGIDVLVSPSIEDRRIRKMDPQIMASSG